MIHVSLGHDLLRGEAPAQPGQAGQQRLLARAGGPSTGCDPHTDLEVPLHQVRGDHAQVLLAPPVHDLQPQPVALLVGRHTGTPAAVARSAVHAAPSPTSRVTLGSRASARKAGRSSGA